MGHEVVLEFKELEKSKRQARLGCLRDCRLEDGGIDCHALLESSPEAQNLLRAGTPVRCWLESIFLSENSLPQIAGWCWKSGMVKGSSWSVETRHWRELIQKAKLGSKKLSRWWDIEPNSREWTTRCQRLWEGRIRSRVEWIASSLAENGVRPLSLIQAIDSTLRSHAQKPGALILLGVHCRITWTERNKYLFEQQRLWQSPKQILEVAIQECRAAERRLHGEQADRIKAANESLFSWAAHCWSEQEFHQGHALASIVDAAEGNTGHGHSQDTSSSSEDSQADTDTSYFDTSSSEDCSESNSLFSTSHSSC
ncbi:hypothetical protein R1sor_023125 [Riccia sorocarpa]|uniref:Uncharacterized protein n=1 Tax=Riccia sorocarpa TaxID=122646 RepID=A0ABD3GQY6_9MARC